MLPPLLKIIINEPGLLSEHLEAYSQLLIKDVTLWRASLKRQMKWKMALGGNLILFLLLSGIAIMLWGATQTTHWSLIVIPLIPLFFAIVSALMMPRKDAVREPFVTLKKQLCSDIQMLKGGNDHG